MSEAGDRSFHKSVWEIAWQIAMGAAGLIIGVPLLLLLSTSAVTVSTEAGALRTTGYGVLALIAAGVTARVAWHGIRLVHDRHLPLLSLDAAGVHASARRLSMPWTDIASVEVAKFGRASFLCLTARDPATYRPMSSKLLGGAVWVNLALAKDADGDIVTALRGHGRYSGDDAVGS